MQRRRPLVAALAAGLLVAASACGAGGAGSTVAGQVDEGRFRAEEVSPPTPRPSFTLTDTDGRPFDFAAETAGRTTLLYFGYLNCPDVCPVHLANIENVFDVRPDIAERTTVVFVTVDPARDSPAEVRAYLDRFDTRFVGLVGTPEEVRAAEEAVGVPPAAPDVENPEVVGHAGQVLGYGADDLLHVQFPGSTRSATYAHDLAVLVGLGVQQR